MMSSLSVFLLLVLSNVVFTELILDPSYEGNESIGSIRFPDLRDEIVTIEWDMYASKRPFSYLFILDPPQEYRDGKPVHSTATGFHTSTTMLLDPYTEYNLTIQAFPDYREEEAIAVSEVVSFKTKASLSIFKFFLSNKSDESDYRVVCFAMGTPPPDVNITRNGQLLELKEVGHGFWETPIWAHFFNRSLSAYGTYKCSTSNEGGTVTKEIEFAYNDGDADLLVESLAYLMKKTERIRTEQETRMNTMEQTLRTMGEQVKEINDLLQAESVNR